MAASGATRHGTRKSKQKTDSKKLSRISTLNEDWQADGFILLDSDSDEEFDLEAFHPRHVEPAASQRALLKGGGVKKPPSLAQFDKFAFVEPIKIKAAEIFVSLDRKHMRQPALLRAQFYCIWRAHIARGYQTLPSIIGAKMGLSDTEVAKAIGDFQKIERQPAYKSFIGSADAVAICGKEVQLSEGAIATIQGAFAQFLEKAPSFKDKKINLVAVAYICYYLSNEGQEASLPDLVKIFNLKISSVKMMIDEISAADNDVPPEKGRRK